jgi:hypothetical protein
MLWGLVSVAGLCGLLVALVAVAFVLALPFVALATWLDKRRDARDERELAERRRRYRVTRRAVADFRTADAVRASVARAIKRAR